jgi:hypothetical protein
MSSPWDNGAHEAATWRGVPPPKVRALLAELDQGSEQERAWAALERIYVCARSPTTSSERSDR